MKRRGQTTVIVILLLLIVLGVSVWYLYQNIPGAPEQLEAVFTQPELEVANFSSEVKQFYPNMKFNHNAITYNIDSTCGPEKRERMIEAFNELASQVGIISFSEAASPDIAVSCSSATEKSHGEYFIAGRGGTNYTIPTGRYHVITEGTIMLYEERKWAVTCQWPNIELHELLHALGFEHSPDENSVMFPSLESCSQKLDNAIIQDLKDLYSQPNLPDLYFENVDAVKKGRYLDFNITVKNSGTIPAETVVLSVFDKGEKIENFDLNEISFGAGVTFQITNLKLKSRGSEDIELVLDFSEATKEIDEENNVAKLTF
jgi:hypothetical protein